MTAHTATFAYVALDIAVIIVAARLFGRVARMLRQPAVIGEIVAGIALGPSLLGLWNLDTVLFPTDVVPYLKILAQIGLILFMFIVGLELDLALIKGRQKRAGVISLLSIVTPFALGALVAVYLYPMHDTVVDDSGESHTVQRLALMLFLGVAMSITAFPVLARILAERRMNRTTVGVLALAAAAIDDVLAWTLLAFVVAVVRGESPLRVLEIIGLSAAFVAVMFLVVRPVLARVLMAAYRRRGRVTPDMLAIVIVGIMLSALATERIGIHEIFGAFLFGAIMPREGAQAITREVLERLEQVSVVLLLPIFFVVTGFGVNLRLFSDLTLVLELSLILLVAIGGKFGGAFLGARIQGMTTQHSSAVALLMNTRGLTELAILTAGKQLGVLDTEMFTMMVVMALVTTAMAEPLLRLVYPDKAVQRDIEAAEKAALGSAQTSRALVVVDGPPTAMTERMIQVADAALAHRTPREIVLTRFLSARDEGEPLELGAGVLPDLAGMAEAIEGLERFAAQSAVTTTPLRSVCRFGSPSGAELLGQIRASDADFVVVSEEWVRSYPSAVEKLDAVTVLVVPAELPAAWFSAGRSAALGVSGGEVLVRDDGSADGARAVLVATQAATATGRGLAVVVPDGDSKTRRRAQQALEPLRDTATGLRVVNATEAGREQNVEIDAVASVLDRMGGSQLNLRDAVAEIL